MAEHAGSGNEGSGGGGGGGIVDGSGERNSERVVLGRDNGRGGGGCFLRRISALSLDCGGIFDLG